uniref:Bm5523 n=1 Tax=Brugia malayi TaxID=6279 RepID=A0A0H5SGR1_BRUMA|nr:Bm5523 [Brugia malayi]
MVNLPGENEKVYPCEICGRNFVKNSLMKHEVICQKMVKAKRKVFDSGKQRATGSDITIDNVINARKEREKLGGTFPRPKTSWREKHETFVNAVSTSKQTNNSLRADTPFSVVPKDYVKCEYCERSFNKAAAERHIPFCKTQQKKKGPIKIQKIRSQQSNATMIRSEANDCHRLTNKSLSRDNKMNSKKNDYHSTISEHRSSISSRRSGSSQRLNVNNISENDRRRERSLSRKGLYRAINREQTSAPMSRQSSLTRKDNGTEKKS